MDYKKLAEEARNLAVACDNVNLGLVSGMIQSYAEAIEELLDKAESAESRVKELEFNRPVQVDGDVFELSVKLAKVTAERDKAVSDLRAAAIGNGLCDSCKHRFTECNRISLCDLDSEDHWEWEGL